MPLAGHRAEPLLHTGQELRRQRDLRQKDECLPAGAQAFGHRLKVDLGLARSGDAAQQDGLKVIGRHGMHQRIARGDLIAFEPLQAGGIKMRKGQVFWRLVFGHHAQFHQPLDHAGPAGRRFGQLAQSHRSAAKGAQGLDHAVAGVGQGVGDGAGQPVDLAHRWRVGQPRRAGGQPQHRGQRRQRVVGGARQEGAQFFPHRACVQHAVDRAHLGRIPFAIPWPPDHAQHPAWAKRHLDEIAGATAAFGGLVVQHAAQGFGCQNPHRLTSLELPFGQC